MDIYIIIELLTHYSLCVGRSVCNLPHICTKQCAVAEHQKSHHHLIFFGQGGVRMTFDFMGDEHNFLMAFEETTWSSEQNAKTHIVPASLVCFYNGFILKQCPKNAPKWKQKSAPGGPCEIRSCTSAWKITGRLFEVATKNSFLRSLVAVTQRNLSGSDVK